MTCYVFYKITRPSFSTDKWVKATPQLRGSLCKDLIKNYDLKGMSKDDIIKVLGQPDNKERRYWYELGEVGANVVFVPVNKATLVFIIGDDNRIIEYYASGLPEELENESFESSKWLRGNVDVRRKMFNDLIRHDKLKGMYKTEVEELLGKFDGCDDRFYYNVGNYGRFFSLGYYLIIKFDKSGRVKEYFVDD